MRAADELDRFPARREMLSLLVLMVVVVPSLLACYPANLAAIATLLRTSAICSCEWTAREQLPSAFSTPRTRAHPPFFNDTATTETYTGEDTLSLHDALP
eukprot:COSAG06_NODE_39667_length_410_cov_0.652733_1_plen_99_part_01